MVRILLLLIALLFLSASVSAGPNDPIVDEAFTSYEEHASGLDRDRLEMLLAEVPGCHICSRLETTRNGEKKLPGVFSIDRVLCADKNALREAIAVLQAAANHPTDSIAVYIDNPEPPSLWFRGAVAWTEEGSLPTALLSTINSARMLIWSQSKARPFSPELLYYARNLSDYLYALDTGWMEAPVPRAVNFGLPDSMDFYAKPPDYVIEGYANYKAFLNAHDTIRTDFAYGLTEFVPSDSLWEAMKEEAPRAAFPNKEWPMLQHEYKKFFERGGDVRIMQTLTREGYDTLRTGEYFFAVSVAGKARFGRELLREEVDSIEQATGNKVPRANHAFLFPGEPILTAGAFSITSESGKRKLERINAQSGHYFYSNVSPTIREDIAERSDYYLTTLGHFFVLLDSLGIPHDNVVISKL